jgi:translocation and assembly module TamB
MTQLQQLQYGKVQIPEAHGLLHMQDNVLAIHDYQIHMGGGLHVVNGTLNLQGETPLADLTVRTDKVRAEALVAATGKDIQVTGDVDNEVHLVGSLEHPHVSGKITLTDGSAYGYLVDKAAGTYAYDDGALKLDNFVINALATTITLSGTMDRAQNLDFAAQADDVDLEKLPIKDEQVALTGFVSAQGTLKGTLQQPLFSGKVKSKSFTVNGQEIDSLDGSLTTNGKDINKLVATAEQKVPDSFSGLYAVDLNLDAPAKVLQGTVNVSYGKLQSLLKMAKLDYDVDGEVTGSLDINRAGPGTGGEFHASIDNLRIHKLVYHQLLADGHIKNKVVHIDDAHLEEKEGQSDKGFIAMGGDIDWGKRTLKLELGGRDANPAIITAVMKDPVAMTGTMNMAMQLSGSFDNPVGNASVEIDNGTIANVSLDKAVAMLSLKDDNVKLEQVFLTRTQYKLSAYGNLPVDLFRAAESRHNPNAQMNIKVNLDEAGLGILSAVKGVDWAVGPTQGSVVISGNLEEPLLNGKIAVSDGALKLKNVNTLIDKLDLDVQFAGNKVLINNISAALGKGTVVGSGTYALRSTAKEAYHFNLKAKNADLDANIFKGRINADVAVSPQSYRVNRRAVGSEKEVYGYRPFVKADIRLDDVLVNMPTVPSFGDSDSNMGLDVNITLGPKVHLFNKYLYNMWLKGGLHIGGSTRYKIPTGSVEATNGTVNLSAYGL